MDKPTPAMTEAMVDAFVCGDFDLDSPFGVEAMVNAVYQAGRREERAEGRKPRRRYRPRTAPE